MQRSLRGLAGVAIAGILGASVLACGSAPPAPGSGTSTPGGTGAPGDTGAPGASTASGPSDRLAELVAGAAVASVDEFAVVEDALADELARKSGLIADVGADTWAWLRDSIHEGLVEAAESVTLTGSASQTASLDGGPPRTAIQIGPGGMGVGVAGVMIQQALSGSGPSNLTGNPNPLTSTRTANGQTTSATFTYNLGVSTSGSTVVGDVSIGGDYSVTDAATGAVIRQDRFMSRGKITLDFCPDVNGKIRGHVSLDMQVGSAGAGAAGVTVEADIEGTVGEDAYLNAVDVSGQSSQTTSGFGGGAAARSQRVQGSYRVGVGPNGVINHGNVSNVNGQVISGPADLTDAEVDDGFRQLASAASLALVAMGDAAQQKWRNGACVEIRSSEQSRDVQKNELVQFESKVFHKIEGVELHKNIVNDFTGKQSLDPVDIPVPAPVTNSFKAGPMVDDTGTIVMTTTSNRGIGTLTITFKVKGGWYIEEPNFGGILVGLKCGDPDGEWVINGTYSVAGFDGDQQWIININPDLATGKFQYTTSQVGQQAGVKIYLVGTAKGTVTLSLDPVTGDAHMVLQETKHTFVATTQFGGQGSDRNAKLVQYTFDWDVGGDC